MVLQDLVQKVRHSRWRFWTVVFGVFLLVIAGVLWTPAYLPPKGPHLQQWASPLIELGEGKPGEILTGTFALRNTGQEPLLFQIEPNCSCAELRPRNGTIAPHESTDILVGVKLRHQGKQEHVRLKILTNDPEKPESEFNFEAECPAPFLIYPPTADFGHFVQGKCGIVRLSILDRYGVPLPSSTGLSIASSSPLVHIQRDSSVTDALVFMAALEPSVPIGYFSGDLSLSLVDSDATVNVPVYGKVSPLVSIAPKHVELLLKDKASGHIIPYDFIIWRNDDQVLGKLHSVEVPYGLAVRDLTSDSSKRRRFRIEGKVLKGTQKAFVLKLGFEGIEQAVHFEVSCPLVNQ